MKNHLLLKLLILSQVSTFACSTPTTNPMEQAQSVWLEHEQVIAAVAGDGSEFSFADFEEACEFFLRLTGIEVPAEGSYVSIWTPTLESPTVLPELREWYAANKERLYWDSERETVILRPRCVDERKPPKSH